MYRIILIIINKLKYCKNYLKKTSLILGHQYVKDDMVEERKVTIGNYLLIRIKVIIYFLWEKQFK